jgi:hypothetical protein
MAGFLPDLVDQDDKGIMHQVVCQASDDRIAGYEAIQIGQGGFSISQIQASYGGICALTTGADLPDVIFILEEWRTWQVIHIVFRLMITKR